MESLSGFESINFERISLMITFFGNGNKMLEIHINTKNDGLGNPAFVTEQAAIGSASGTQVKSAHLGEL